MDSVFVQHTNILDFGCDAQNTTVTGDFLTPSVNSPDFLAMKQRLFSHNHIMTVVVFDEGAITEGCRDANIY